MVAVQDYQVLLQGSMSIVSTVEGLFGGIVTKIALIIAGVMTITCIYLHIQNKTLTTQVSQKTADIKSYIYGTASFKDEANKWHSISIEQGKSIDNLKQDKDSLNQAYLKMLKQNKIKPADVTEIGTVSTEFKHDTVIKYNPAAKDTSYDLSKLPYITEWIYVKEDSLWQRLTINNKQSLVWHTKRETIEPPKHFFLLRWFQKKQNVTYVDIINDNPFIKTTDQNFQIITK